MEDFKVIKGAYNEVAKRERHLRERKAILLTIPNQGGAYILRFPDGTGYIGKAVNLRKRIEKHLIEIFPSPKMLYHRKCNEAWSWYDICRESNPEMELSDIDITWFLSDDPCGKEKELLQSVDKGDRHLYYNTQWNNSKEV
jgi:hypothetical protein